MISYLSGHIKGFFDPFILVVTSAGVGYDVLCPTSFRHTLHQDDAVTLWVETIIRPEVWTLYGFPSFHHRQAFQLLTSVPGVGGRMALKILSCLELSVLKTSLHTQDIARLTQAEGVGVRLATRLCHELKDKALTIHPQAPGVAPEPLGPAEEVISALTNLGYKPQDIRKALEGLKDPSPQTEERLRQTLAALTSSR